MDAHGGLGARLSASTEVAKERLPGSQPDAPPHRDGARNLSILIVDLNNFATFPTLAVGILVGALREDGHRVSLLCPLAHDVPATVREHREGLRDHVARRVHLSTWTPFLRWRDAARRLRDWWRNRPDPIVVRETNKAMQAQPDAVLLSAYLQHHASVVEIGRLAQGHGIPMILGGPMFNVPGIADTWRDTPGLTAIVGAESDLSVSGLVQAVVRGDDVRTFAGVTLPVGTRSHAAPPLKDLDRVPVPDFTDFPWERYPLPVIPVMTGRGCQWNRCVFCSDIVSASGRTFRTRSVRSVLDEMCTQSQRHGTSDFVFLDLKLNSDPGMLRGIVDNLPSVLPGARWIGTVHVDLRSDNGLSRPELEAAFAAGMRRVSFGLETGSQPLLDRMDKGTSVEANGAFIRRAHDAGLSVRCTMFKGFPGETPGDLEQTADFLEAHEPFIDRVRFNEFAVMEGTPIYEQLVTDAEADVSTMRVRRVDHRRGLARGDTHESRTRAYRRAKARALRAVHSINRRELRSTASAFDGLM